MTRVQQLRALRAFAKAVLPYCIILFDWKYDSTLQDDIGLTFPLVFLGDIPDEFSERQDNLKSVLEMASEPCLIFFTEEFEKDLMIGKTHKHYWLMPENQDLSNVPLRLDSLTFTYDISTIEDKIIISETYAIKNTVKIIQKVGVIKNTNQLNHFASVNIWERRSNLRAINLVNTYLPYPTQNIPIKDQDGKVIGHSGYLAETLHILEEALNFTTTWTQPKDENWGKQELDGTWNGMMAQLITNEVDLCTSGLLMDPERLLAGAAFSVPTNDYVVSVVTAHSARAPNVNFIAYIHVFTDKAWTYFLSLLGIIAFVWTSIMMIHPSRVPLNVGESVALVGAIVVLQREYTVVAKSVATRTIFMTACLLGTVMFAHYSAVLTSLMTIRDGIHRIEIWLYLLLY